MTDCLEHTLAPPPGGRTTDALGLGDAVFPAMLAGWALRKDSAAASAGGGGGGDIAASSSIEPGVDASGVDEEEGMRGESGVGEGGGYFSASLGGYCLGCFLCEVTNNGG